MTDRSPTLRAPGSPALGPRAPEGLIAAPFLAVALVCAVFAFVGLDASSYWIDELFSLFVVDHDGGLPEVLRRALTDTHPPAYYFIAYGWAHLFGSSETAMRALSALAATATLPVLFFGLKGVFSLPARSFAAALAAGSKLFFEQSQNARSYALCVLLGAALMVLSLAIHRRRLREAPVSIPLAAGIWAVGLLASFTHFYAFLVVGAAHLFLLLTARTWRGRGVVVASGLSLLGLMSAYVVSLLRHSRQDIQNMWFSNSSGALAAELLDGLVHCWSGLAIGGLLLLLLLLRRGPAAPDGPAAAVADERRAALVFCGVTVGVTVLAGLVVSLTLAPSFGGRSLLVLGPAMWTIGAWLYDAVTPDPRSRSGLALLLGLIALTGSNAFALNARHLPRNEEWRASADYVSHAPGCAGQPIPVVLPFLFGPSTPFFRGLAERHFFGRYARDPARLQAYAPAEFSPADASPGLRALLSQRVRSPGCAVLAWGVHDLDGDLAERMRRDIAETAGVPSDQILVRPFNKVSVKLLGATNRKPSAYVFERAALAGGAPAAAEGAEAGHR